MIDVLRQISVTCFFTSYLVVLVLEGLRMLGRIPGRALAVLTMTAIGLFTHLVYLILRATDVQAGTDVGRLATWADWSLMISLGVAIAFFLFYVRRPDTIVSFFFMPAVLALIGLAVAVRDLPAFDRSEATQVWQNVHAISMMIGSAAVLFGFLAGAMFLVQSWRLKRKRARFGVAVAHAGITTKTQSPLFDSEHGLSGHRFIVWRVHELEPLG